MSRFYLAKTRSFASRLLKISGMFMRFDNCTRFIENANHSWM